MIGLLDCNNFYVSCERLFNPKLLEKPVIILSNNDGCVISRSEEAKQIGVKMGEPFFKLKKFIIDNNISVYYILRKCRVNVFNEALMIYH